MQKLILIILGFLLISANLGSEEWFLKEDFRDLDNWEEPPVKASLAIMTDSDNTEGAGTGYIDYIRIGKQPYVR